jgi:hypothetical protein
MFPFRLTRLDGTPADPPTLVSAVPSWSAGDVATICPGLAYQVVRVEQADEDSEPTLVVEPVSSGAPPGLAEDALPSFGKLLRRFGHEPRVPAEGRGSIRGGAELSDAARIKDLLTEGPSQCPNVIDGPGVFARGRVVQDHGDEQGQLPIRRLHRFSERASTMRVAPECSL